MYVLQSNGYISEDNPIWFEEILRLSARCLVFWRDRLCNVERVFFLPEVLYLVRYEMGLWIKNAYLHVGQKQCLIEMKKYIFKRNCFLQSNAAYWKKIIKKVSVCKSCPCHLELVLQKKGACLIIFCSQFQCFHCPFKFGEKSQSWMMFFKWVCITT